MGKLSPTCSCFKSPIVLHFLSIVYDVQNVATTAALSTILVWIREIGTFIVSLSSISRLYFHFFSIAWVYEQITAPVNEKNYSSSSHLPLFWKIFIPIFSCYSSNKWKWHLCDHDVFFLLCVIVCFPRSLFDWFILSVTRAEKMLEASSNCIFQRLLWPGNDCSWTCAIFAENVWQTCHLECPHATYPSHHLSPPALFQTHYYAWIHG